MSPDDVRSDGPDRRGGGCGRRRVDREGHEEIIHQVYHSTVFRRYADEFFGLALVGAILLIVGITYLVITTHHVSTNARAIKKLEHTDNAQRLAAETGSCIRLQRQREGQNTSEARQYLILHSIAINPKAVKSVRRYYATLTDTTSYRPPTNCPAAVLTPTAYHQPGPIPYTTLGPAFAQRVVNKARRCARLHITNCHQPIPPKSVLRRNR